MISFLPGESMMRPWKPVMFTDDALVQAATMLRELHDATRGLVLPPETEWRGGKAGKSTGQVIRHGDLGPWNTLWEGDRLTGLIDWDFAEPGLPLTDLAQLALYFVPLRGEDH
jgi:thiamine kinase-like enzyme